MWFGILGSMEVRHTDGSLVPVGGPRVRSLLALLLLNAGRMVTAEALIDGLYGESPPDGAANALQSQVSRLRRGLGQATGSGSLVELAPAGYRLAVDPQDVDVHRFERLAGEGRDALAVGDHARSRGLGEIARLRGELVEARRLYELALSTSSTGLFDGGEGEGRILVALGRIAEAEGNVDEARAHHRQTLALALRIGYMPVAAIAVEALAGVALLECDGERAALLLGVGKALRGSSVPGDPDVARVTAGSRALIGEAAYTSAFERGAAMRRNEALTLLGM